MNIYIYIYTIYIYVNARQSLSAEPPLGPLEQEPSLAPVRAALAVDGAEASGSHGVRAGDHGP